jgi:hypothetical protein
MLSQTQLKSNVMEDLVSPYPCGIPLRKVLNRKHQCSTRRLASRCRYKPASNSTVETPAMYPMS